MAGKSLPGTMAADGDGDVPTEERDTTMPLSARPDASSGVPGERLQSTVKARGVGIALALFQITVYAEMPYPAGIRESLYALVGLWAIANVAIALAARGDTSVQRRRTLSVASLALDTGVVSGIVWLYAFDDVSAVFIVLMLLPIEGAVMFGLPGASWTAFATSLFYVGREWFGTQYGHPWEWPSVTFRVGVIVIAAMIVGMLARDLDDQRRRAEAALAEGRRANAWRGRLVAMLAHDLRSPLAGVRTGLSTLREHDEQLPPETRRQVVDSGIRQADRMLAMTRDLLDLARSEEGRLVLDRRQVPLAVVVQGAMDLVGATAAEVTVDVPDDLVLDADAERLEQVVANLLTNARRHGAPPVEIVGREAEGAVWLSVRDHGPGLPDGLRDRVFEPFATADDGTQSVGLGTWVIAHLVELHGGEVAYEDADPGARFLVRLPQEVSSAPPGRSSPSGGPFPG